MRDLRFFLFSVATFCCLHFPLQTLAQVKIAFFEMRDANGKIVELEPGGRFFHVAISVEGGGWLHAYPYVGVQYLEHLPKVGTLVAVVELPDAKPASQATVRSLVGRPYDYKYDWSEDRAFYCTELVHKLTSSSIPLQRMSFKTPYWEKHGKPSIGKSPAQRLGLSPDDYFNGLLKQGYKAVTNRCEFSSLISG